MNNFTSEFFNSSSQQILMNCPMCTIVVFDTVEDTTDIFAWSVLFSAYNPIFLMKDYMLQETRGPI